MQYSEILKETQFLLGLENDTQFTVYTKEQITRHSNLALNDFTNIVLKSDGRWQWDDKNHSDLPTAVTHVVSNQGQYTLSANHLLIQRLEYKTADGTWRLLKSIDESDIKTPIAEYEKETGDPVHFDVQGEVFMLYPKPKYESGASGWVDKDGEFVLEDSLRIYFSRPASYFEVNDTTKEPGFAKQYHGYIPLWNAYRYAMSNPELINQAQKYKNDLKEMEVQIKKWYATRTKRSRMSAYRTYSY